VKSLQNAFRFIGASFKLAFSHIQRLKPWLFLTAGGLALLLLWLMPVAAAAGLIGFKPIGLMLIGGLSFFFLISLVIWGEIASLPMCRAAAETLSENHEFLPVSPKVIYTHGLDILLLTLILPGVSVIKIYKTIQQKDSDYLQQRWLTGQCLFLPVVSLEALSMPKALDRVEQIIKDNLLRFKPGLVKVTLIARIVQGTLFICGAVIGAVIANLIITDPAAASHWQRILGIGAGMSTAWLLVTIGNLFSTFTRSFYHTALYTWVRNVEDARKSNEPQKASPPKILQQALGSAGFRKKEPKNGTKK
jgi:hypothetical protein